MARSEVSSSGAFPANVGADTPRLPRTELALFFLGFFSVCCLVFFWSPIKWLVSAWLDSPEFNYGPIVPPLALLMVMRDLARSTHKPTGGYWALPIALFGFLLGLLNYLGPYVFPAQIGLGVVLVATVFACQGERRALSAWPGMAYIFLSIPLAGALLAEMNLWLQLISSELGVAILRLTAVPVFLEGNVIDLGTYKLEVAEACSGLRYILPLASFGFLCAYLFRAPFWQRVLIVISTVPIAIVMNSFRIALTGWLVDSYGIPAAEGFLHAFEGWLVFTFCIAILTLELKALCYLGGGTSSLLSRLDLEIRIRAPQSDRQLQPRGLASPRLLILLMAFCAVGAALALESRTPIHPERLTFAQFPRDVAGRIAVDAEIDQPSLDLLKPTDYLSLNFNGTVGGEKPINVWIAYYAEQGSRSAPHSPLLCIPGGGWSIEHADKVSIRLPGVVGPGASNPQVNRLVIAKGGDRQLVYYWFSERGLVETNEYLIKWHTLRDSILKRRTDGALVRFVVPVQPGSELRVAEEQLQTFISKVAPILPGYLPGK